MEVQRFPYVAGIVEERNSVAAKAATDQKLQTGF
jgi:hypothetical protein